jgi:hypothetical protein
VIDVIIPTIPGREASLERCQASFRKHTDLPYDEIVLRDSETCGWGWKQGLKYSRGRYVLLACDDQECVSPTWAPAAINAVDEGFIACPRVYLPDGTIESNGGDMNAFCHIISRPQRDWTPVDYTTVPFLSREHIDAIGMLEVHYASDVWVSYRGRQLGIESVLRHGFDIVHHREAVGRGAGMTQNGRDAVDCAAVFKELQHQEALA